MSANRVQGWLAVAALVGFVSSAAPVGAEETAESGEQTTDPEADSSDVIVVACRFVRDDVLCEEVLVTGTQIRGADVTGLLPVSVLSGEDAELFGVDSGDELLELLPEQGQNYFNEEENISGGVNSARGDMGAFNLRNLGTGNTLVLLNGRRMVNAASYQTERVGGSFVPVNTVNSNTIPVYGVDRVEVLKDGASAIYGADAVAGVVNNVLSVDYEGFRIRARYGWFDQVDRKPLNVDAAWGSTFNGGRTNLSVMGSLQSRDRINAQEDVRWSNSDFRRLVPEDSPWDGNTRFRNNSVNSSFGQFDVVSSARSAGLRNTLTDGSGEFEVYPAGDDRCGWTLNDRVCGAIDGQGTQRYNLNTLRDLSAELQRMTLFAFLNHELDSGAQSFTELMVYRSDTNMTRHPSASFSSVKLLIDKQNHYNPFGPVGSPNRLPDDVIPDVPAEGLDVLIDNYRYTEVPRTVDNSGDVWRLLQGFRGSAGAWDWEAAALYSRATREDITRNRVSNTLMTEALADPTPAAYNPFSGGVNTNIERALVDVRRDNEMELFLADFKINRSDLFNLPAGPVGFVAGVEVRRESFEDDRDPRLDGTIVFTDNDGDTFPYVSDVVNSSPTPDNSGTRRVGSLFSELQIPVFETVALQVAARYESFSDVGDTVVGKVAFGWRPVNALLLRASWSEAFRAPNLITVNEVIVARQNNRTDYACVYAADNGGDPDQDVIDCVNSTQRTAQGSSELVAERSDNSSIGVVIEPAEGFTVTFDYWRIEKEDTIGLFGEENHTVLDLLLRLEHGGGNCAALQANPAVVRQAEVDPEIAAIYEAAGICPAGDIRFIADRYENLDTRILNGFDTTLRFEVETGLGDFRFRYLASFLHTFEQDPGGDAGRLLAAQAAGRLPADFPLRGFENLVQDTGNQKQKHSVSIFWRNGPFGASVSGVKIGKVYQSSLTLADDSRWWLAPMTVWNATVDYYWDSDVFDSRFRFGVRNIGADRAPLADGYFGFLSDVHRDYGRNFYIDVRLTRR